MKLKFELINSLPVYTIGWLNTLGKQNQYYCNNHKKLLNKKVLETDYVIKINEGPSLVVFLDDITLNYHQVIYAYLGRTEFVKNIVDPVFSYKYKFILESEVRVFNPTVTDYINDFYKLKFTWTDFKRKKL